MDLGQGYCGSKMSAVRMAGFPVESEITQKSFVKIPKTSRVDLVMLQKFPNPALGSAFINILDEIPNFKRLGNVLLKSPQGERVREIQSHNRQGSSRAVLYDIFQTWLTEEDNATWDKLVQHLYKVNLTSLAERIEGRLRDY